MQDPADRLRERFELAGTLIGPTPAGWAAALAGYLRGGAGSAGIVDRIAFAPMPRCGIGQVLTNDCRTRAAGFGTLFQGEAAALLQLAQAFRRVGYSIPSTFESP